MKREVISYQDFINEATKNVVYPTNFQGMVQSTLAGLYSSVMAIAQELANEKAARNPQRYDGSVEEVDITRAMNMIFHSDWKKQMKKKALGQMVNKSMERAGKQDKVVNQKNIRAIGRTLGDKDFQMDIDKSSARFSDSKGNGRGSNQ
jgi:hypothetical protein